jgi:hypothetical protein
MTIDKQAPVQEKAETRTAASPQTVWEVLAGVDDWPSWNPDVARARLDGPLADGATIRWKAGGARLTSRIAAVAPEREIGWTGRTLGLRAVHVWRLEPDGDGTRIVTEESMSGMPARLFRTRVQSMLNRSLAAMLAALTAEAEERSHRAS